MPIPLPRVRYITSYPVDPAGPVTGPQRVMRSVIGSMKSAGADVEVWSAPYGRPRGQNREVLDSGVRVRFVGPLSVVLAATRRPEYALHIGSFSLYHALPFIARKLLSRFRETAPVVYTAHGLLFIEAAFGARVVPFLTPWAERLLITRSDHVVVLSTQMADLITRHYGIPAERIEIVDTAIPKDFMDAATAALNTARVGSTFIYAGEFRDVKGLDVLMTALAHLHDSSPERPWTLVLAGAPYPSWEPPPKWNELRGLGRIEIVGRLPAEELTRAYASALCLVLPSSYEPFGMVVLESMACGTPAIVSDRVGARDLIDDGISGLVTPYGDHVALSAALSAALDDPVRFADMGAAARRRVCAISEAHSAERYLQIYAI